MKKLFCAILLLLSLCASCFAGTLYIKAGEKIFTYENVILVVTQPGKYYSPDGTVSFFGDNVKIVVGKHSEWWYVE